jgi:hypothetical protein
MKIIPSLLLAAALLAPHGAFAADSSVAGMTAGAAIGGTDLFYCSQAGGTNDRKCTGSQVLTWVQSGWGTGVATWVSTPTSANLAAALTNETGTGVAVFGIEPSISGPHITGVAFASLPTPAAGIVAYVTDAANVAPAFGDTVSAGSGTTKVLVWYNGTNWTVIGK